eukprot:PhF_6_TR43415/c0_g1_i2/m.66697/K17263/CAND1; cullin-associated NEDD8-dissociated protein 1
MTSFNWSSFNERIKEIDNDRRYMALFDLCAFITKEGATLDEVKQKEMLDVVLSKLQDKHSDVQSQAVRTLGPLIKITTKEEFVESTLVRLANECLTGTKETRDIASIALKAAVEVLPTNYLSAVRNMATPLVNGLPSCDPAVKVEIIDILGNVLKTFGPVINASHEKLQAQLIVEMTNPKTSFRKVITGLSLLAVCSSDALFTGLVRKMLEEMAVRGPNQQKYIQLCNALSHTCGTRLGVFIKDIMGLLAGELTRLQSAADKTDAADEVRENILQAYESLITRCPQQVTPYVDTVLKQCQELIKWDPNYEDDGGYEDEGDAGDEEFEQDPDFAQGMDEDDGISWRVRKAAAKCIQSILEYRPAALGAVYQMFCSKENPILPDRFRDRQEGVRLDVFQVFIALLKKSVEHIDPNTPEVSQSISFLSSSFRAQYIETRKEAEVLYPIGKQIITSICNALKSKNVKVKCGCFQMLRELVVIAGPALDDSMYPELITAAQKTLTDKNPRTTTPQLKFDCLQFVLRLTTATTTLVKSGSRAALAAKVCQLCEPVFALTEDKHYLTVAEALRVCGEMVRAIFLLDSADKARKEKAAKLFKAVNSRMTAANVDKQVKETAIYTMSKCLRDLKQDVSPEELGGALKALGTLLGNETTRLMTVKTIHSIARVELPFTADIINGYIDALAPFLRQVDVILRQHSISALKALMPKKEIKPEKFTVVVNEAIPLIVDTDLNLANLSLQLVTVIAPKIASLNPELLANSFKLVFSPLLQGNSLSSMEEFLVTLFTEGKVKFDDVVAKLLDGGKAANNKGVTANVARLLGSVVENAAEKDRVACITKIQSSFLNSANEIEQVLGLQCIGEIGRRRACPDAQLAPILQVVTAKINEGKTEDVKTSAASALGKCTKDIEKLVAGANNYLLLRAAREAIVAVPAKPEPKELFNRLLPSLFALCDNAEESSFNVLAESLGEMGLREPETIMPKLAEAFKASTSVPKRTVLILAAKYTVADQAKAAADKILFEAYSTFLTALSKSENFVSRRAAVLLFTALGHRRANLLHNDVGSRTLTNLYLEAPVDQALLKIVDLGPFKHTQDEGEGLRKAVYECLDVLVDAAVTSPHSLLGFVNDYSELVRVVAEGAEKDINTDITQLCFGILGKLARFPGAVTSLLEKVEKVAAALKVNLSKKADAKAHDADKQKFEELMKAGLRALINVNKIPSACEYPCIKDVLAVVQGSATLKPQFEALEKA